MIPYSNQAVWDPITKAHPLLWPTIMADFRGRSRWRSQYSGFQQLVEHCHTHPDPGITPSHGYGHIAIRPDTGELYVRQYAGGSGPETIFRKPLGGSWAGNLTSPPVYRQVGIGTGWWTGALSGSPGDGRLPHRGAKGLESSRSTTRVWNSWQQIDHPDPGGDGLYHGVLDYSPVKNVAVFGGGNAWPASCGD
jgi:hypothetical protein